MKKHITKNHLLSMLLALALFSCLPDDHLPKVENITKGDKWGIQIGSTPAEVFTQLQQLASERDISDVAIVYRTPFPKPDKIRYHLYYYHTLSLYKQGSGPVDRVIIELEEDEINTIHIGGAHQTEVDQWPMDAPDSVAISKEDTVNELYQKLLAIYELPGYSDYNLLLPDKPLSKPFDPDMENFDEWAFNFFVDLEQPGRSGRSSVRLYFKNGKLDKIRHEYNEFDVYE